MSEDSSSKELAVLAPPTTDESLVKILEGERDRQYEENVRLIAENASLRKQLLESMDLVDAWRRRAEAAYAPGLQISEGLRQQMMAQAQCVQSQANAAMAAQSFYAENPFQQGLGQSALGQAAQQQGQWYHCDCTPPRGRAGFLRGDGL